MYVFPLRIHLEYCESISLVSQMYMQWSLVIHNLSEGQEHLVFFFKRQCRELEICKPPECQIILHNTLRYYLNTIFNLSSKNTQFTKSVGSIVILHSLLCDLQELLLQQQKALEKYLKLFFTQCYVFLSLTLTACHLYKHIYGCVSSYQAHWDSEKM